MMRSFELNVFETKWLRFNKREIQGLALMSTCTAQNLMYVRHVLSRIALNVMCARRAPWLRKMCTS